MFYEYVFFYEHWYTSDLGSFFLFLFFAFNHKYLFKLDSSSGISVFPLTV